MLKSFFTIGLVIFLSVTMYAQGARYGASAGIDVVSAFPRVTDGNGESITGLGLDAIVSFHIGGLVKFRNDSKLGLSLEPGYIRKGGGSSDPLLSYKFSLDYLQMPVLLEYYFNDKIFLSAGPEFAYMLGSTYSFDDPKIHGGLHNAKEFDLGLMLGLNFNLGDHSGLGLRSGVSFLPYDDYSISISTTERHIKDYNYYVQVNYQYMF